MITIQSPQVFETDRSRLQAVIDVDGESKTVWFEVEKKYGAYLCWERCDAFLIGLLHYAMVHNHDITCLAPLSEDLYYQLDTYLIDALCQGNCDFFHRIKITADIAPNLENAGAVGTGISCGIDSLHTIATHANTDFKSHRITHLVLFNVGVFDSGTEADELFKKRVARAEAFCSEYNFEFVKIDSNFMGAFVQDNLLVHTFRDVAFVYILQKLFAYYYYSSGHIFLDFSLHNSGKKDSARYDLFLLDMFSNSKLRFYSEGATKSRIEKTRIVANYEPSYKYLNICNNEGDNCGKCEKCIRTLLILEILGKLDNYKKVLDIEGYKKNRKHALKILYREHLFRNIIYRELHPYYRGQIPFFVKLSILLQNWKAVLYIKLINSKKGASLIKFYKKRFS